jgi:hypothetical protein
MFRFTIRDMLWLTVVVAVVVLWRIESARQEAFYRGTIESKTTLSLKFDDLKNRAASNPALKEEVDAVRIAAVQHGREVTVATMDILKRYRQLKTKVDALPPPLPPSVFDEWPPEPLGAPPNPAN